MATRRFSAFGGWRRGSTRAAHTPASAAGPALAPTPPPRSSRLATWVPLLAVALVAAVGVVLLDSRPAQAQTTDYEYWSATLTVKEIVPGTGWYGCSNTAFATEPKCSTSATLTDDDVTYDATTYTIKNVSIRAGTIRIEFSSTTPFLSKQLTFDVDGTRYAFADDSQQTGRVFIWSTSTTWTLNQTVNLRITGPPPLPKPRPLPPPDPLDPDPEPQRQCACTQVAASLMPDACAKCAIIRSCNKN